MNRIIALLLMTALYSVPSLAQQSSLGEEAIFFASPQASVEWLSWDEAMELAQKEERKVFLFIHTDWCNWCKRMQNNTLQQPEIADYINNNFYPVLFNAELAEELEYQGKVYTFVEDEKQGHHELAAKLLNGRMSFPSAVFMDEKQEVIQSIIGFKTRDEFMKILIYFAEDYYTKTPWSTFKKQYEPQMIKDR